jgi:hypothetical protein
VWSNEAVADDDPDDPSPWTRDDWVPESAVPDEQVFGVRPRSALERPGPTTGSHEPRPEDFDAPSGAGDTTARASTGRKVVAGALIVALLLGSAGALLSGGDDPDDSPDPTEVPGSVADVAVTSAPTTSVPTTEPTVLPTSPEPGESAGDTVPIAPVVVGEPPSWTERLISVPEELATMAPTEVVTLSQSGVGTGVVNVTEFPSGRNRSIDVSDVAQGELQLSVGVDSIVVFDSTTLFQIRDGEPVVETELNDGIIFVQPRTGAGDFVVTTPRTGADAPEQDWLLRPDGSLELMDSQFLSETTFFSRVYSPFGDALFSGPGGVYAVDPQDTARRISTGALLATGSRHWAIEECDEMLRCAYSIIAWDTGAVTSGELEALERFGYFDPSTRISPDGRTVAYRSDIDGSGRRKLLDVATGTSITADPIDRILYPDSWASDSSGLFYAETTLRFVDRATGSIVEVADLDFIRTVATRAPTWPGP